MTNTLNNESTVYRLSARWMMDHLDCCQGEEYWGPSGTPEGEWSKRFWVGSLDARQVSEVVSRADYYASFTGSDRADSCGLCSAAASVIKQVAKQAPDSIRQDLAGTKGFEPSTRQLMGANA